MDIIQLTTVYIILMCLVSKYSSSSPVEETFHYQNHLLDLYPVLLDLYSVLTPLLVLKSLTKLTYVNIKFKTLFQVLFSKIFQFSLRKRIYFVQVVINLFVFVSNSEAEF